MSVLKRISGRSVTAFIPECKTVVFSGNKADDILFDIECLLARDVTKEFINIDDQYGITHEPLDKSLKLTFTSGALYVEDGIVKTTGTVPNVHYVRLIGNGVNTVRSCLVSESTKRTSIFSNLFTYTSALPDSKWIRLCETVNSIVGYEMCNLVSSGGSKELKFDLDKECEISAELRDLVYLLVSECYLTPDGYIRVLLLPNIEGMSSSFQLKLLDTLDNIKGHSLTLSTAKISSAEAKKAASVVVISV